MKKLYPLKFKTLFKDKIWGGNKIKDILNKDYSPLPNCGETWEISGVEKNISVVKNGFLKDNELHELIEIYMGDLVGDKIYEKFGLQFPLLIKFIDANDYLSVQVHPGDKLAKKRHNTNGKTEMWYVIQADEGAELISGFNTKMDENTYLQHLHNKTLKDILNVEKVHAGDVFYIPAGRVHAIGPGILLAEIQQTSDTTYRIYDWDRKDGQGKSRELHTEQALKAIDFAYHKDYRTKYKEVYNAATNIIDCPYFDTNQLYFNKKIEREYIGVDSFVIYICLEGAAEIDYHWGKEQISKGEAILLPAVIERVFLSPHKETKLLEVGAKAG